MYKTSAVFICLLIATHIGGLIVLTYISQQSQDKLDEILTEQLSDIAHKGDEIALRDELIRGVDDVNGEALASFLQEASSEQDGLNLSVTDAMGFILTRTFSPNRFGDNVFLTSVAGRELEKNGTVQSVEKRITVDELSLVTGRYVIKDGARIGSLFASVPVGAEMLKSLRDENFSQGVELAAYTSSGVYQSTFEDIQEDAVVRSYFHRESPWIASGESDKTLRFENGQFYEVVNVVFPGLEDSPGGFLIFVPRKDFSLPITIAIMVITLSVFFALTIRAHVRIPKEMRGWFYPIPFLLSAFPIVIFAWCLFALQEIGYTVLQKVSYPLYNSTISIEPSWGIFNVGSSQQVSLVVFSGDEAINAIDAKIGYDPDLVSIDSIDLSQSPCAYVLESAVHPEEGYFRVTCILLGEKDNTDHHLGIANIQFTPIAKGNINFTFDDEQTQVLANDGLGTDVLRTATNASYNVDTFNFSENNIVDGRTFVVFSPTQPNQAQWYSDSFATFMWLGKKGNTYRYAFDENPETIPDTGTPISEDHISIPLLVDGVYYFHLQSVQDGNTAHYRVQVDMTEPKIITADASDMNPRVGDVVRFSFSAIDAISGVQNNYYVDLGNGLYLPVGEDVYIPFFERGEKTITLRVFDEANNVSEKKITIKVRN